MGNVLSKSMNAYFKLTRSTKVAYPIPGVDGLDPTGDVYVIDHAPEHFPLSCPGCSRCQP